MKHGEGHLPLLPDTGTGRGAAVSLPLSSLVLSSLAPLPGNFPFPLKGTTSSSGASPLARCGSCALPWVDVGGGRCSANQLLPGPLTGAGRLQGQRDALCMASPSDANNCPLLCLLREAGTGLAAGGLVPQLPPGQMFCFAAMLSGTLTPWPAGVGPMGRSVTAWPLGPLVRQGHRRKLLKKRTGAGALPRGSLSLLPAPQSPLGLYPLGAKAVSSQNPHSWAPNQHDFCRIQSCCLCLGPKVCSGSGPGSPTSVRGQGWNGLCLLASSQNPPLFPSRT